MRFFRCEDIAHVVLNRQKETKQFFISELNLANLVAKSVFVVEQIGVSKNQFEYKNQFRKKLTATFFSDSDFIRKNFDHEEL